MVFSNMAIWTPLVLVKLTLRLMI